MQSTTTLLLAALCAGTLHLTSCQSDAPATTTAPPETSTAPGTAGPDHAAMGHAPAGGATSPLLTSMNEMMQKMMADQPTGNTDHDFARMMLAHHRGAVAMADIQLRDGKDATMRQMATQIKADQQQEIKALEAAAARLAGAKANYQPQNPADPFTRKMKASMDTMMQQMPATVADPDRDFNRLMTVHHQSAVDMAQAQLTHGQDPALKAMARQMIDAQQREIQQFNDWYRQYAGKP